MTGMLFARVGGGWVPILGGGGGGGGGDDVWVGTDPPSGTQDLWFDTDEPTVDILPIGSMTMYGGDTAPNMLWMICQGQAVSRTTYATLFTVFGTKYGAGNGTTTFNIPDMRGRTAVGTNVGGAYLATTGLSLPLTAANAIVPQHGHTVADHFHSVSHDHGAVNTGGQSANHTHNLRGTPEQSTAGGFGEFNAADAEATSFAVRGNTGTESVTHVHSVNLPSFTGNSGNASLSAATIGVAVTNANLPPAVAVQYICKVL